MRKRKTAAWVIAAIVSLYAFLSIPVPDPPMPAGAVGKPFTWRQDEKWKALEASFRQAREIGCKGLQPRTIQGLRQGRQYLRTLAAAPLRPDAQILGRLEVLTFGLGIQVAACPERIPDYIDLVTKTRILLKLQSREWDMDNRVVRERLYRLLYGGRAALEEIMLQAPRGSYPALITSDRSESATPFYHFLDVKLHSGDILVSRGGAPTSALIARGNDYPGNFSHVALFYVNEQTGLPSIIESHIEVGVVVSTLEDYINDKKLRVMVLRPRLDLPQMQADPNLPHKAAKKAYEEAKSRHIPYDFAMDFKDPSRWFCSEVASNSYSSFGVDLWKGTTRMSSPGMVKWLSYFGVSHFETQAPADLEYDPQLTVVAEWRDPETLWKDHVDGAVIEAMLEGADEGDVLSYPWWKLAPARLVKAFCAMLNLFGGVGPIPEGMDAAAALRNLELSARHEEIKKNVLDQTIVFQEKQGYRPPYWELVRMANKARLEFGKPSR